MAKTMEWYAIFNFNQTIIPRIWLKCKGYDGYLHFCFIIKLQNSHSNSQEMVLLEKSGTS